MKERGFSTKVRTAAGAHRLTSPVRLLAVLLLLAGTGLAACGKPSLAERMAGTYATEAVQAELEEHEEEVISGDLHGRLDSVDKDQAAEEGAVWARLRLHEGGRFEYEGPVEEGGAADVKLGGRWIASTGLVDLTVEQRSGPGAEDVPGRLSCPATPEWIDLPFVKDAQSGRPVRLSRR